jgi:hypothetical protein
MDEPEPARALEWQKQRVRVQERAQVRARVQVRGRVQDRVRVQQERAQVRTEPRGSLPSIARATCSQTTTRAPSKCPTRTNPQTHFQTSLTI